MPADKASSGLVLDDIRRALPSTEEAVKLIGFSKLLSEPPADDSTLGLSDMVKRYGFSEPKANAIVRAFQADLRGPVTTRQRAISDDSLLHYGFDYPYMEPSRCTYGLQI